MAISKVGRPVSSASKLPLAFATRSNRSDFSQLGPPTICPSVWIEFELYAMRINWNSG
jgi:hypothetical protein